jgi:hypothetical protein
MILTPAQLRALTAVRDGRVSQRFFRNRNGFLRPKGVSPISLYKLQQLGLIEAAPGPGPYHPQELTVKGLAILKTRAGRSS